MSGGSPPEASQHIRGGSRGGTPARRRDSFFLAGLGNALHCP